MRFIIVISSIIFLSIIPSQAIEFSGTVKDSAAGTPIEGAVITLQKLSLESIKDTTDSEGAFSMTASPATYLVIIYSKGYTTKTIRLQINDSTELPLNFQLSAYNFADIAGTITDSDDNTPLSETKIVLWFGINAFDSTVTNEDGHFEIDSVPYGLFSLAVTREEYNYKQQIITINDSSSTTFDIAILKIVYSDINGTVTDLAAGTAIPETKVLLYQGLNLILPVDSCTTNEEGTYTFSSVSNGIYTIVINHELYNWTADTVSIADAEPHTKDFALKEIVYSPIAGTVTDSAEGTPLADAKVVLYQGLINPVDSCTTNEEGTYLFENIPNGMHMIIVTHDAYYLKADTVIITDTETNTTDFALIKKIYASIAVTVTDSITGKPIPEADIILYYQIGVMFLAIDTVTSSTEGTFRFDDVEAGVYWVKGRHDTYLTKNDSVVILDTADKVINLALAEKHYCSINGVVTDSTTGEALAGIKVFLRLSTFGVTVQMIDSVTTDGDGNYSFDSVFTGLSILILTNEYALKVVNLTVPSDEAQTIDIALLLRSESIRFDDVDKSAKRKLPSITVRQNGVLYLADMNSVNKITLYSINGQLVWKYIVNHSTAAPHVLSVTPPVSSGKYIVCLRRKESPVRQMIVIP